MSRWKQREAETGYREDRLEERSFSLSLKVRTEYAGGTQYDHIIIIIIILIILINIITKLLPLFLYVIIVSFIHSRIYIAPLQGNYYSEVLPTPARSKRKLFN